MTKIWKNCKEYNGEQHEIYHQALNLAKQFDDSFEARIPVPLHMGVEEFPQGNHWCKSEVLVYWDGDHQWFQVRGSQGKSNPHRITENSHPYALRPKA